MKKLASTSKRSNFSRGPLGFLALALGLALAGFEPGLAQGQIKQLDEPEENHLRLDKEFNELEDSEFIEEDVVDFDDDNDGEEDEIDLDNDSDGEVEDL